MGLTACTEPQCLYSTAIPLLPYGPYGPYRASVPACKRVNFTFLLFISYFVQGRPEIFDKILFSPRFCFKLPSSFLSSGLRLEKLRVPEAVEKFLYAVERAD